MPSAGEILRAERTRRNRSLSEISNQTCIGKRYLEAIEVDRVQDLPGEFFYKSFLRQYAQALGLDAATTQKVMTSAVPCEADDDPVPVLNEVYQNAQVGKSSRWNAPTGVAVGLLLLVLAACSGLYAVWQHLQAKREAAEIAMAAEQQSAQEVQTAAPAAAPLAPNAAAVEPSSTPPAAVPPASAPGEATVDLSATEPAWVSLSSEGKTLYTGVLDSTQTRRFTVGETAKLVTGNAAGIEVKWNGAPVGPIGPRGHVRTVLFNAEGFQIVPPRPKVQTSEP